MRHLRPLLSQFLNCLPNLLNLLNRQLRLIQQNKMLTQILIIKQNKTICLHLLITPSTSCFLNIILQTVGNIIMNHRPHILLIHPHTKCRSCHHNRHFPTQKSLLMATLLTPIHLAVKAQHIKPILTQLRHQLPHPLRTRNIHNRRTTLLLNQLPQRLILFLIILLLHHPIMQILTRYLTGKHRQIQIQTLLKINTNILYHLRLSRCRKTWHRNRTRELLLMLQSLNKLRDIQIIHPKILPPCRKTMRLINHKTRNRTVAQHILNRAWTQQFGRNIQQRCRSIDHPFQCLLPLNHIQQTINRYRRRNPLSFQIIHLIFHQRLQRRNHHRQTLIRLTTD